MSFKEVTEFDGKTGYIEGEGPSGYVRVVSSDNIDYLLPQNILAIPADEVPVFEIKSSNIGKNHAVAAKAENNDVISKLVRTYRNHESVKVAGLCGILAYDRMNEGDGDENFCKRVDSECGIGQIISGIGFLAGANKPVEIDKDVYPAVLKSFFENMMTRAKKIGDTKNAQYLSRRIGDMERSLPEEV